MEKSARIEFVDLAKGICILLVVAVHIFPECNGIDVLSWLRMPLYFCLSGIFFKEYDSFIGFARKKTDKLLIPFIAWYLISYAIFYAKIYLGVTSLDANDFSLNDIFTGSFMYNNPIWFLLSLFWCAIWFALIKYSSRSQAAIFVKVLASTFIGWIFSFTETINLFYFATSLTCLPFFYAGYMLKSNSLIISNETSPGDIILISLAAIGFIYAVFVPEQPPVLSYYENKLISGNPVDIYISSLAAVIILLSVCKYIRKLPGINWLGRFSIIILVTHMLFVSPLAKCVQKLTGLPEEGIPCRLIVFVAIFALMGAIIPLSQKYLPYITAQKEFLGDFIVKKKVLRTINK